MVVTERLFNNYTNTWQPTLSLEEGQEGCDRYKSSAVIRTPRI